LASTITLDGQLTDWTNIDRLDFGMTGLNGSKVYGRFVDGTYHFAIESSTVSIGADSTMWLNTDKNTATGYSFWDLAIAPVKTFRFTIRDSFANGNACANIGTFSTVLDDGSLADTDLIAVYRVNDQGQLVSMAAHWEIERTMATVRKPE